MKRSVTLMFLLMLLFPSPTLAGSWQQSNTPANECDSLARACTGAARELKAARELIRGYEDQIAASDIRINVALQQVDSLRKLQMLSEAKAQELEAVISAEREAKAAAVEQIEVQKKRIKSLEKSLSRTRKFALVAGTAAIIAVLIGARR